jgi:hypothetical protein
MVNEAEPPSYRPALTNYRGPFGGVARPKLESSNWRKIAMKPTILIGGLTLALAFPMAGAFAAITPHASSSESNLVLVAAKGQRTCGTNMYWSTKEGKCMDAREKSGEAKQGEPPGWVSQCMKGKMGC